jgi:hypothetical protein
VLMQNLQGDPDDRKIKCRNFYGYIIIYNLITLNYNEAILEGVSLLESLTFCETKAC